MLPVALEEEKIDREIQVCTLRAPRRPSSLVGRPSGCVNLPRRGRRYLLDFWLEERPRDLSSWDGQGPEATCQIGYSLVPANVQQVLPLVDTGVEYTLTWKP